MLLNLNERELQKLSKFNQDKELIEALKKALINGYIGSEQPNLEIKAAAFIAIQSLEDIFRFINNISTKDTISKKLDNMI